jgi:hypothetical protein
MQSFYLGALSSGFSRASITVLDLPVAGPTLFNGSGLPRDPKLMDLIGFNIDPAGKKI